MASSHGFLFHRMCAYIAKKKVLGDVSDVECTCAYFLIVYLTGAPVGTVIDTVDAYIKARERGRQQHEDD